VCLRVENAKLDPGPKDQGLKKVPISNIANIEGNERPGKKAETKKATRMQWGACAQKEWDKLPMLRGREKRA